MQSENHDADREQRRRKRRGRRWRPVLQMAALGALVGVMFLVVWLSEDERYGPVWRWTGIGLVVVLLLVNAFLVLPRLYRQRQRRRGH